MKYQFLPQPDPDLEPVSPEVQARLMEKIHAYDQRRQGRRRATVAVLFAILLAGIFAYVRTHTMVQKGGLQPPPMATRPPVAKPKPLPVPAPGPISDSSTTMEYVKDPVRTGTDSEPEEYNVIKPDGTTRFVSHKPYKHP